MKLPTAISAADITAVAAEHNGQLSDSQIAKLLGRKARDFAFPLVASTLARVAGNCLRIAFFVCAAWTVLEFSGAKIALLAGIVFARAIASYIEHFAGHWVAFASLASLRIDLYRALVPQAPGLGARTQAADIATIGGRDIDRIEVFYAHTLVPVMATILTIPILTAVMVQVGWLPALVTLLWLIVSALLTPWAFARTATAATRIATQRQGALAADAAGYVTALPYLKLLPGRDAVTARIGERAAATYRATARANRCDTWRYLIGWCIDILGFAAVLMAAFSVAPNPVTLALVGVGAAATIGVTMCLRDTAPDLIVAFASARRLFGAMSGPARMNEGVRAQTSTPPSATVKPAPAAPEVSTQAVTATQAVPLGCGISARLEPERGGAGAAGVGALAVELLDVQFAYPDGRTVGPLNLAVPTGAHVLIEGPSGSGKSTLAGLVAGVHYPARGQIRVNGEPVWGPQGVDPLPEITVIEQNPYVFAASVRENLLVAEPTATDADLWRVLEAVRLDAFVEELGGLDARIGERGSTLSGGQRQRLALARGLLRDTPIYVLDEIGANLDEATFAAVRAAVAQQLSGKTIIEISHRLGGAPLALAQ